MKGDDQVDLRVDMPPGAGILWCITISHNRLSLSSVKNHGQQMWEGIIVLANKVKVGSGTVDLSILEKKRLFRLVYDDVVPLKKV